jgi:hypothetical protein
MLALALPVVPSAALKAKVFGGIGLGGSSAAAGGTAVATSASGFSFAGSGVLAKAAVVAALAAGGEGTATVASHGNLPLVPHTSAAPAEQQSHPGPGAAHTGATAASKDGSTSTGSAHKHKTEGSRRSASGTAHGFTPVTGESNGARARAFAQTRGRGKETSAAHRHVTAQKRAHPVKRVKAEHVAAPKRAPSTHTQPTPAPKAEEPATTTVPATTTPTTTTTTPQTTPNGQAPPPPANGGNGAATGGAGKQLGAGRHSAATG